MDSTKDVFWNGRNTEFWPFPCLFLDCCKRLKWQCLSSTYTNTRGDLQPLFASHIPSMSRFWYASKNVRTLISWWPHLALCVWPLCNNNLNEKRLIHIGILKENMPIIQIFYSVHFSRGPWLFALTRQNVDI